MKPEEIQKLLGGYATGTLTGDEQEALFAAALEDQQLFDALAKEQALRDVLRDPAARAQLLAALEHRPARWWSWRPAAVAAMAGVAALALVLLWTNARKPRALDEIAEVRPPASPPAPPPAGPLVVMPPGDVGKRPGAIRMRREFVPPKAAPARPRSAPDLPEPPRPEPQLDTLRRDNNGALAGAVGDGVVGGVPPPPAQPLPRFGAKSEDLEVKARAAAPLAILPEVSQQHGLAVQARLAQPAGARALFYGAQPRPAGVTRTASGLAGAAPPASPLGLRYTILRKEASGDFVEIDAGDLHAGDTVELRFTANSSGYLSISGATPVSLAAMAPYTSPPLPAGQNDVTVVFAKLPQTALPAPSQNLLEAQDRATYVVNPTPGQPVGFSIKLQYK